MKCEGMVLCILQNIQNFIKIVIVKSQLLSLAKQITLCWCMQTSDWHSYQDISRQCAWSRHLYNQLPSAPDWFLFLVRLNVFISGSVWHGSVFIWISVIQSHAWTVASDTGADGGFIVLCPEPYSDKKCQTGMSVCSMWKKKFHLTVKTVMCFKLLSASLFNWQWVSSNNLLFTTPELQFQYSEVLIVCKFKVKRDKFLHVGRS